MTERQNAKLPLRAGGRISASQWTAALSAACETAICEEDLVDPKVCAPLKDAFFEKLRSESRTLRRCFWRRDSFAEVDAYLASIHDRVCNMRVVLFSSMDKYFGAIGVPAGCVLGHAQAVWDVVEEDLCLTTPDLQHGMCLEMNFYGANGEYVSEGVFELTVWGDFATGT